jgi:hypothetical protein
MLVTSLLHVILVMFTHYFSRIYQSSLFLCSRIPFPPMFPYHSSQCNHFLHGCPSFVLPLNPSLKRILYALPLSTPFFHSGLFVAYYSIYSVVLTSQRNVLVCSFFYSGQSCMFPITYHCCFSISTTPNLLFPAICISMSI